MVKETEPANETMNEAEHDITATTDITAGSMSVDNQQEDWSQLMNQIAVTLTAKEYVENYWKQKTRPDGRLFSQTRATTVVSVGDADADVGDNDDDLARRKNENSNPEVLGSALVTVGETRILSTVTFTVGQSTNKAGDVAVTLSFPCGQDSPKSAPIESYIQRLLLETIPLEQLSLQHYADDSTVNFKSSLSNNRQLSSKQQQRSAVVNLAFMAIRLQVSLQVVHNDGNLWDAAVLASVAALRRTILPALEWNSDSQTFCLLDKSDLVPKTQLQLPILPVSLTLGIYYQKEEDDADAAAAVKHNKLNWMTDPTRLEEESGWLTSCLTVVIDANSSSNDCNLVSLEYSGQQPLTVESDLLLALHMAAARAKEIKTLLLV